MDEEYIQALSLNYSTISKLFHALLNNDSESAGSLAKVYKDELFAEETPINILPRMLSNTSIDLAIWLSLHTSGIATLLEEVKKRIMAMPV